MDRRPLDRHKENIVYLFVGLMLGLVTNVFTGFYVVWATEFGVNLAVATAATGLLWAALLLWSVRLLRRLFPIGEGGRDTYQETNTNERR